jgi:hypothetical protein
MTDLQEIALACALPSAEHVEGVLTGSQKMHIGKNKKKAMAEAAGIFDDEYGDDAAADPADPEGIDAPENDGEA